MGWIVLSGVSQRPRWVLAVLLAVVMPHVGSGVLRSAPASAETQAAVWKLTTHPIVIDRHGHPYRFWITAVHTDSPDSDPESSNTVEVWVHLTSHLNPPGPVRSTQRHRYERLEVKFDHSSDLRRASVASLADAHGFALDLHYTAGSWRRSSCGGGFEITRGTLSGTLSFGTGAGSFGRITELAHRGRLQRTSNDCAPATPASAPCPHDERDFHTGSYHGGRSDFWWARVRDGSATATLNLESFYDQGIHQIVATLPASHVSIDDDASSVRIRGAHGSYFTGTANASTTATRPAGSSSPSQCGNQPIQMKTTRQLPPLVGSLTAHYATGQSQTTVEHTETGTAVAFSSVSTPS